MNCTIRKIYYLRNIFSNKNDLVLGDLDLARDASVSLSTLETGMGTIQYMAPEIFNEYKEYTEKIDIW